MRSLLTLILLTMIPPVASSQNQLDHIAPWEMIAIPRDYLRAMEQALIQGRKQIAGKFAQQQSLQQILAEKKTTMTLNQSKFAEQFFSKPSTNSLMYQPILCRLDQTALFSLVQIQVSTGIIQSMTYTPFDFAVFKQADSEQLLAIIGKTIAGWTPDQTPPPSPLKLGLHLKKGSLSSAKGQLLCANLLIAKELHRRFRVLNTIGQNNLYFLQRLLRSSPLVRSNRSLHFDWNLTKQKVAIHMEGSEGIFGSKIGTRKTWTTNIDQAVPNDIPAELLQLLEQEEKALRQDEYPQVVKIYGAWAYLDKGRAWGLKINDRLQLIKNGEAYKGHIVGFYGPGKRLQSPKGYRIQEGAILYLRKGQGVVKIGDQFAFDPKSFPTPWPPAATQ